MKGISSRRKYSDILCGAGAVCFTLISFLVQQQILPYLAISSVALFFIGICVWGLIRFWEPKAFLSASVIAGALILAFAPVALTRPFALNQKISEKVILVLICLPVFWVLLTGFRLFMQNLKLRSSGFGTPLVSSLIIGLYTAGALCLSWIKWYPSGTSPDTRHQWGQIHGTLRLNDIHALGHTIFMKGLLSIWDNYAMVILVHILMIALLYALFAYYIADKGVPLGWMMLAVSLFTACCTPTESYMYPWKDTPYTFTVGILTLMILHIIENKKPFTIPKAILLGVVLAYTTLFRANGIIVLLAAGIWVLVWYIRNHDYKKLLCTAAAIAVCFAGVNFYGYHVLKAESPKNGFSVQVFGSGIAAMVTQCGQDLSKEARAEIKEYFSPTWMASQYVPWETRRIIWTYETHDPEQVFADPNMELFVNNFVLDLGEHRWDAVRLYFKNMPSHFAVCARDVLYNTFMVWGFPNIEQFFYSNIFLLVLLMVGVGACWNWKSVRTKIILFVPVIANAVSIAISTITNEQRYLLPTFTLFPVLLLCLLCTNDHQKNNSSLLHN